MASSISFDTGVALTAGSGNPANTVLYGAFVSGAMHTITILANLEQNGSLAHNFPIIDGTVTVRSTLTGATLFQASIGGGSVSSFGGSGAVPYTMIVGSGLLENPAIPMIENGGFLFDINFVDTQASFFSVTATTSPVSTVPEPRALEGLLLGTGMLGLAEMTRRKLGLGT